jgi:hypothetical protein
VRGLKPSARLIAAGEAIDRANAEDPTSVLVRGEPWPLAEIHGRLAVDWVERLAPGADDALLLAARAHHLRRWQVPRTTYPDGRAGYLRWRRDQKQRHADDVAVLLTDAGYETAEVERVQRLIRRDGLAAGDPDAQAVEDAACLVFLETQLAEMIERIEPDKLAVVIRKTAAKMSPAALALVPELSLDPASRTTLLAALA